MCLQLYKKTVTVLRVKLAAIARPGMGWGCVKMYFTDWLVLAIFWQRLYSVVNTLKNDTIVTSILQPTLVELLAAFAFELRFALVLYRLATTAMVSAEGEIFENLEFQDRRRKRSLPSLLQLFRVGL